MKNKILLLSAVVVLLIASSCSQKSNGVIIGLKNNLDLQRTNEVVSLNLSELKGFTSEDYKNLVVRATNDGKPIPGQLIDNDKDGILDMLVFQATIEPNQKKKYQVSLKAEGEEVPSSKLSTFARFVPERIDDFSWENDRVAFRTYGPKAQEMFKNEIPGGIISSGIDCWLKKVDYPIINKWYKGDAEEPGYYHRDNGEGLDNYHVGTSRGCGGSGVWVNDKLYTSENYTAYELIANGPIRTKFALSYNDWEANAKTISEHKTLTIDLGRNFTNYSVDVKGTDVYTVGITLHDKKGAVSIDSVSGWFGYWNTHEDSELGTALIINPEDYAGYKYLDSPNTDESHLLVHIKVRDNQVSYYSGFTWLKSGQFASKEDWESYLSEFSMLLSSPIEVEIP